MKQLCVTIRVSPGAAVRAGKSIVGDVTLTLSDKDLACLTEVQRYALAKHVECYSPHWGQPLSADAPPVEEASVKSLAILLDARIKREDDRAAESCEREKRREQAIAKLRLLPDDSFFSPPRDTWGIWSLRIASDLIAGCEFHELACDMIGRREEFDAKLNELNGKLRAARAIEAQEREALRIVAEQKAAEQDRIDRERTRSFLVRHAGEDAAEWFDQLAKPSQARSEIVRIMEGVFESLPVYRLNKDTRVGHTLDEVTDLEQYRKLHAVADKVFEAAKQAGIGDNEATIVVEPIVVYRPAEPGEDADEDGEVFDDGWFRIAFAVGSVTANLYAR